VTPSFFATLNVPIVQGRNYTPADRPGALPVAIVNRAFAQKFFKNADPIGRRIRIGQSKSKNPWLTIVGISGDIFTGDQNEPTGPIIFQPFAQARTTFAYISARTSGPPMSMTQSVRDAVAAINPDIPLYWLQTLDSAIAEEFWFVRIFGTMFVIFGVVALFLASVGLYAVTAYSVSQRTQEIGVRMALGAQASQVLWLILRSATAQLAIGLAIGLAGAIGVGRLLQSLLVQTGASDPITLAGITTLLSIVSIVACVWPARRATRLDPIHALRYE
jgi:predicted permease